MHGFDRDTASTLPLTCQVGGGGKSMRDTDMAIQKCILFTWLEISICVKTATYPVWASGLIPMRCLNLYCNALL